MSFWNFRHYFFLWTEIEAILCAQIWGKKKVCDFEWDIDFHILKISFCLRSELRTLKESNLYE